MVLRLLALLGLSLSVLILPWWLTLVLAIATIVFFDRFYEVALPALLFDLIYGLPGLWPGGINLPLTILALVAVALARVIKPRLLFYRRL